MAQSAGPVQRLGTTREADTVYFSHLRDVLSFEVGEQASVLSVRVVYLFVYALIIEPELPTFVTEPNAETKMYQVKP